MRRKIFKTMLAVSIAAVLICVGSISYLLYGYFEDIIKDELKNQALLIAQQMEETDDYIENMNFMENRVTLVAADGQVLYDSEADADSMENHKDRAEIREAGRDGDAYATRYSDTLSTRTIYYAISLENGQILRVAQQQSVVGVLLRGLVGPVILIFAVIIIAASVISRMLSKWIVKPVNELDLNDEETEEPYPELAPFIRKIRHQNDRITIQMEELKRKQQEFEAITDHMREGFIIIDGNMEILSHNEAALRLLGDGNEETPQAAFELNRSRSFRTAVEEALGGSRSLQLLETEDHCYQIMANPVTADNHIAGAVIIVVDVTEKEQRERLRREFTSNVSHELKTPLTTIYGVSDMIAGGIVKAEDVTGFAENIREESGRMINLIDDIIKLSRMDEEQIVDEKTATDLFETAKYVLNRLRPMAEEKKVSLYLEGESCILEGFPSLCDEIIHNLCENGIKYNREGGCVTVTTRKEPGGVLLMVEDTGIGISHEYQSRIFERFFRVDKSRSRKATDGTGLGLSIVKHAVAQMNGNIQVESTEGVGTKISVIFSTLS